VHAVAQNLDLESRRARRGLRYLCKFREEDMQYSVQVIRHFKKVSNRNC
jgi:hypothetical protein